MICRYLKKFITFTDNIENENTLRVKRQIETFDADYPTAASEDQQEESGFWDRVVNVALKLFSKFIEWLNS